MRFFRLFLILAVALALAPGTFVRTTFDPADFETELTITPISNWEGIESEYEVTGAWELTSPHPMFGGFSSLADGGEAGLIVPSDRGWMLKLPLSRTDPSGEPLAGAAQFFDYARSPGGLQPLIDLEAITRDPASGRVWTAYESLNVIQREEADDNEQGERIRYKPPQMRQWAANSGPEALEHLHDGSFLVLSEAPEHNSEREDRPGLLFAGDPLETEDPIEFRFGTPKDFAPVDATALPDGKVLILLRRVEYRIPANFDAAIMLADPAQISVGAVWSGRIIARFTGPIFGENFEGIAFVADAQKETPGAGGDIYLVTDDNISAFQRSLLVRMAWKSLELGKVEPFE